jgi:DNA invertase Pin-like site-specific DNA recombinase
MVINRSLFIRFCLTSARARLQDAFVMTNEKLFHVALYSRISTKCGRQDVQNQLQQLRDYCAKQGWVIVKEFVDRASGKRSDREQFLAMFEAASRHEFDCLMFWSLDRFSREGVLKTLEYLQRLTGYGIAWRSFTEMYLDSLGPFRDGVLAILACIARQERIRISERTLAGLARARKAGHVGGRPKVVVNRDKVLHRRRQGVSLSQIADEFGISKGSVFNIVKAASA